ncbi:2001_t:CDS:1, partial [Diversispora eburnea]
VYSKADMLNINELTFMVTERIIKFINFDNWDQILLLGWRHFDDRLKTSGLNFAISNWKKIRNTGNMKQVMECGNMDWIEELIIKKFFSPINN